MRLQPKTSQYFLTKEKKLEIHEKGQVFRSAIPIRFALNPLIWLKNCLWTFVRHKKRLKRYDVLDLKDQTRKKVYLSHNEILQVWKHPLEQSKATKIAKKKKSSSSK